MNRHRAAAGSMLFLLVAPGTVVGVLPWAISRWERTGPGWLVPPGIVLIVVGVGALLSAFVAFVVGGLGTPAPVAPTRHLVVSGPNRLVRNPMYLAVGLAILGQAMLFGSWALLAYAIVVMAGQAAFVRLYEEPALRRQFGVEYDAYRADVPAWIPRRRTTGS
jgi:protein-S-isoprenylcysteine O-methyltransferase Ste14